MTGYVIRRVLAGLFILVLLSMFTFLLFNALPADPAALTCGKSCTPAIIEANRVRLGLNLPLYEQYWEFVKGIFVGRTYGSGVIAFTCDAPSLGYSFRVGECVTPLILSRLPVTIYLSLGAFVLWMLGGVLLGIFAALRRGRWQERLTMGAALVGYSFPTFFIGLLFLFFVSRHLRKRQTGAFTEEPSWLRQLGEPSGPARRRSRTVVMATDPTVGPPATGWSVARSERAQRRVGGTRLPRRVEPALHGAVRAAQHGQVGTAFAEGVGVGKEAPFGRDARRAEGGHELLVGQAGRGGLEGIRPGQFGAELAEGPAVDQPHDGLGFIAAHHLVEEEHRRGPALDLVAARADLAGLSRPAEPLVQPERWHLHPGPHPGLRDVARRGAKPLLFR